MITHTIRKGFDIKLFGAPAGPVQEAPEPLLVAVQATDFPGIKAKLEVREGDQVETGQSLFFDKKNPERRFVSPATGTVSKIVLGERRALIRVEITPAEADRFGQIPTINASALDSVPRQEIVDALRGSGLWSLFRERPVGRFANLEKAPAAVFINGMDTEPLAGDPAIACDGRREDLQTGIELLRRLTDGKVYVTVDAAAVSDVFSSLKNVELHGFSGPHPAGLVGTHIRFIQPLKRDETAWSLRAADVVALGEWIRTGHYPTHRVVAVSGDAAPQTGYWRVRQGAVIHTLTGGKPIENADAVRIISGTVLTGDHIDATEGFLGHRHHTVTMIPNGEGTRDLMGWILPAPGRNSVARSTFAWLSAGQPKKIDARVHGGPRANVNIGAMESVTPLDILPTFLVRAIQANDIEEAIQLGLLEVTEEDVALCTFADPCKTDVGAVIRKGLDLYEAEY